MLCNREDSVSTMSFYMGVDVQVARKVVKKYNPDYQQWKKRNHAEEYLTYSNNIGKRLCIDEVSLNQGELYTFVTNPEGKGKKGSIVAMIKGTRSRDLIEVIDMLIPYYRKGVTEVTLDLAKNMELAVKACFPNAKLVSDRFHVIKLALEALQQVRTKFRWQAIDNENKRKLICKREGLPFHYRRFSNNETPRQLLARSRYLLFKKPGDWTENQTKRSRVLFDQYPILKIAYEHILSLRWIYEIRDKKRAVKKLKDWIEKSAELKIDTINTVADTIELNVVNITNFFDNRSTNAFAESFNAKIKRFRTQLKGVTDKNFFIYRMDRLFA